MNYHNLDKEILAQIKPPIWDPYYLLNNYLRKAYENVIPRLLKPDKKYTILDYGCGIKPYYYLFEKNINNYIGIDIGDNPRADQKIDVGEKLKFENNQFDFVLSSQVLEHVENYEQYLEESYRVLKQNGYLLLSTHGTWQYHSSPYDFYRWTAYSLKRLITKHHYEIIEFIPILGQLALTSQLRLTFYNSFATMLGLVGKIALIPISILYQIKMKIEDSITPNRVKERDSAIYLIVGQKV
jgi:ubiquinone/menaquinone biosynthesis C-methylase UbiE